MVEIFTMTKINEMFTVIYQKIEHQPLNKNNYLHVIFQWTQTEL